MAELDTSGGGKNKGGKVRSKKQSTRVDLTAMVDLAFLLITFFMLTTTLAKPQAMDVAKPDKDKTEEQQLTVADNRTMTILLGANNRLEWYMGLVDNPLTPPQVDNYGRNGIRKALIENSKKVIAATGDPKKGLIVLIKPSDQSNYRNFVDILDEMKVSNITQYAIVDISDPDIGLLKRDGLYK
ncbi:ExbD/TolR family protein [Daejeonella lutea]|uniref:Biopolymer transport protein ExbD n=1 Tax=Daejeonella lutea TaxID=572036 RepID=A0A1T5D7Y3_9SPHI|nr:biopolymer transporter ExbD [Daejeonella lutea]SKB67717.1 Biopolymer transport protein ExbD [Daejeonella lutea]